MTGRRDGDRPARNVRNVLGAATVIAVASALSFGTSRTAELATGALAVGLILLGARSCWQASLASTDRRAWRTLSAALATFAACAALFTADSVLAMPAGTATMTALLGLVFRVLFVAAVLAMPLSAPSLRSRWRSVLDLAVVAATTAYLVWGWVLSDLVHDARTSQPAARAAIFALIDVVLVILVVMVSLRRRSGLSDATAYVAAGVLLLAIVDWSIGIHADSSSGRPDLLATIGSFLALGCVVVGAHHAARAGEPRPVGPRLSTLLRDCVPIALAAAALVSTVAFAPRWDDEPVILLLGAIAAVLLLAWQVAVVFENEEMVRAREEQAERLHTLLETAPVMITELDRDGRITLLNSEAVRLLRSSATELLGTRPQVDGHPDAPEVDLDLRALIRGETLRDAPVPIVRPDGSRLDALISAAPVRNRNGEVAGTVVVASDDGPRQRQLAAAVDVQRMEALGQVVGGIAHDFNNRLAVVLGSAEILHAESQEPADRQMLDAILGAGRRAAALVEQLVESTRHHPHDPEPTDLNEAVRSALSTHTGHLAQLGSSVDLDLADEPLPLYADVADLEQLLLNLAVNGCEAMPGGGVLTVTTRRTSDGSARHDGVAEFAEVTVTDTGTGMDETTRTRMLEPFFTTKPEASRSRGLGLAAVQGVVLRARGEIGVTSSPGAGTSVSIRLPIDGTWSVRRTDDGPSAPTVPADGGGAILVVDDEVEVRSIVCRMLCDAGYEVRAASSAHDAVEHLERYAEQIALLITDVVMPGCSGIELAEAVVSTYGDRPILLMSGFLHDPTEPGEFEPLPHPLLRKPIARADLLAAVGRLIGPPVRASSTRTADG